MPELKFIGLALTVPQLQDHFQRLMEPYTSDPHWQIYDHPKVVLFTSMHLLQKSGLWEQYDINSTKLANGIYVVLIPYNTALVLTWDTPQSIANGIALTSRDLIRVIDPVLGEPTTAEPTTESSSPDFRPPFSFTPRDELTLQMPDGHKQEFDVIRDRDNFPLILVKQTETATAQVVKSLNGKIKRPAPRPFPLTRDW